MLKRRVYLLRHAKTGKYFIPHAETNDPNKAAQWASRLSAKTFVETHELDFEWLPYPHKIAPEPPPPKPPEYRVSVEEAVRLIKELHEKYCYRAERWLEKVGVKGPYNTPFIAVTCQWHPWAGIYHPAENRATYSLHHAMMYLTSGKYDAVSTDADYEIIIAHESTHAYQKALCGPGNWKVVHGGDFYAIMRQAMQMPVEDHHHYYPRDMSQKMAAWLQPEIERMSKDGSLLGLALPVSSDKIDPSVEGVE